MKKAFTLFLLVFVLFGCSKNPDSKKEIKSKEKIEAAAGFGRLADASVFIYKIYPNSKRKLIFKEKTSNGKILSKIGLFDIYIDSLEDNSTYLFVVKGGKDWDINNDGKKDKLPTKNLGKIRALVKGDIVRTLKGKFRVSYLSELVYRYGNKRANKFLKQQFSNPLNVFGFDAAENENKLSKIVLENKQSIIDSLAKNKNPILLKIGSIDTENPAGSMAVFKNYAYIAEYSAGIQVVDLYNISTPKSLGYMRAADYVSSLYLKGHFLYVSDSNGLAVLDISKPDDPRSILRVDLGGLRMSLIKGDTLFAANSWSRFFALDITDKTKPIVTSFLETSRVAQDMCIDKNRIYIADDGAGLKIAGINKPKKPKIFKTLNIKYANSVCCRDGYIYAADKNSGIVVIDSDKIIKKIKDIGIEKLYLRNKRLFALKNDGSIDVFYLKNGKNPKFQSTITTNCAFGMLFDKYLYIFCKNRGVSIYLPLFDKE